MRHPDAPCPNPRPVPTAGDRPTFRCGCGCCRPWTRHVALRLRSGPARPPRELQRYFRDGEILLRPPETTVYRVPIVDPAQPSDGLTIRQLIFEPTDRFLLVLGERVQVWEATWPGREDPFQFPSCPATPRLPEEDLWEELRHALTVPPPILAEIPPAEDILAAIDTALAGEPQLCPCGAPARPRSRYCSPDCEPSHQGEHTVDVGLAGYRWRPDLPLEDWDDLDLEQVDSWLHDDGGALIRFRCTVWRNRHTGKLILRLDDGNRYVALPADDPRDEETWARLRRELADHRRIETRDLCHVPPMEPWAYIRLGDPPVTYVVPNLPQQRENLRRWLVANDVDPATILSGTRLRIDGDQLRGVRLLVDDDGHPVRTEDGRDLVRVRFTVPRRTERLPEGLRLFAIHPERPSVVDALHTALRALVRIGEQPEALRVGAGVWRALVALRDGRPSFRDLLGAATFHTVPVHVDPGIPEGRWQLVGWHGRVLYQDSMLDVDLGWRREVPVRADMWVDFYARAEVARPVLWWAVTNRPL